MATVIMFLVVVGTSIWVGVDASSFKAERARLNGMAATSPSAWVAFCLLLWIVGFPVYLATRPTYLAARESATRPPTPGYPAGYAAVPATAAATTARYAAGPPAGGWYPDPARQYDVRYWDGARWTEHVSRHGVPASDPVG